MNINKLLAPDFVSMQIVLPEEALGRRLDLRRFVHPNNGKPARFLLDSASDAPHRVYELTRVGSDMRSALVGDELTADGSIVVATLLHPLFLLIPTLYEHRTQPYPLELILEFTGANDIGEEVPLDVVEPFIQSICNVDSGKCILDQEKLKEFLDTRMARVRANLPPVVREQVLCAVADPANPPSQDIIDTAEQYGAVSMIASSWLPVNVAEWYIETFNFEKLHTEVARIQDQNEALQYMQFAAEAPTKRKPETTGSFGKQPKQPKVIKARNNASVLDMFRSSAKK